MDQILDTIGLTSEKRDLAIRWFLTIACFAAYPLHIGYFDGCSLNERLMYGFCHANFYHLMVNLIVLWLIKGQMTFVVPFAISVISSFIAPSASGVTMGLSGFLFAYFGTRWGCVPVRYMLKLYRPIGLILITMLIPNVNGALHLYTFLIGFFFSFIKYKLF